MRGGRIRGQGTYGCVFQPPLLCREKNIKLNESKVGKITMPEDAENELKIAGYLAGIKDAKNYVIISEPKPCKPKAYSRQKERNLGACEFLSEADLSEVVQLIMPWGGYPLDRLDLDPRVFNFFDFFENILAIGAFLVLNDLCHFDIWGQNFLFDANTKPRLIDFGFTFRSSELDAEAIKFRWRQIAAFHDTETPEVTLMQGVDKDITPLEMASALEESKPAVQRLANLCNVSPSEWRQELLNWVESSQSFQQKDWLTCWKLYWPGFDAWSIGAMILEVLEIQMTQVAFVKQKEWSSLGPAVLLILKGICRSHPAYRLDAVEALKLWCDASGRGHPLVAAGSPGESWVKQKVESRRLV